MKYPPKNGINDDILNDSFTKHLNTIKSSIIMEKTTIRISQTNVEWLKAIDPTPDRAIDALRAGGNVKDRFNKIEKRLKDLEDLVYAKSGY